MAHQINSTTVNLIETPANTAERSGLDPPLGLTRDAGHVYTFNDGTTVHSSIPSVTTILRVLDKSGPLVGWAKRETAACAIRNLPMLATMVQTGGPEAAAKWLAQIPDYQRDTAATMGSRIHVLAEQLARGQEPVVTPEELPFVDSYRTWLAEFRPRFLAAEEMVVSLRHNFAGTLDAIAVIDGDTWLLDLKTGSGVYPEAGLQLAAYGHAEFIGRPGIIRRFRIPRVTRYGVVHVRPGGARLVEYAVDRGTFAAFLTARGLFAWSQGPGKAVVGKPVATRNGKEAA
jgi:hypothetical protein